MRAYLPPIKQMRSSQNLKIALFFSPLFLLLLIYKAYGVSYLHSLIFFGLILLIVVFPGLTIFSWLKITTSSLQTMSLAISLGFAASIIVAKFSRWLRIEALFFLWLLFAFLWCLRLVFRKPLSFSSAKLSQVFLIGVSALFLSFFIILLLDNFLMGRFLPTGEVALRMRFYDGFLRIAVIHELSHSLPPQLPFASGYRLSYHYGMDLFFSLFIRYGHLDVFDVCHRFGLTFLALLLFLNLSIFLKNFLNSDNLTLFGSFYVIFGSGGLAYLFCWLFKAPFTGNIFFNFYFHDLISLNSFLPALVILLAALNSFLWYEREAKVGWLVATSLFLATLFEFKVFLIIPVALSLLLSTSIQIIQNRKKQLIPLTMLTGFFSLPLFLTAVLSSQDIMGYRFSLKPIDWIIHVLRELRLTSWQETWSKLMMGKAQEPSSYLIGLAATLIFLIGAFGFNILAWPRALKSIFDSSGFKSFLASFSFLSIAYFFLFNLYLGRLTRHLLNIYVFYAGLIGLSLFFLLYLKETLNHQKALKRVIILTLIGLLSLPNTVFYTISRIKRPEIRLYSKNFVEAANWVRKTTSPESIIIHPTDMRYICYFAGRRVVLDNSVHSYLDFHLPRPKIRERVADIDRFFHDPQKNVDVLFKYNVSYIWVDRDRGLKNLAQNDPFPASEEIILRPPPNYLNPNLKIHLRPVFANQEHLIYEIILK